MIPLLFAALIVLQPTAGQLSTPNARDLEIRCEPAPRPIVVDGRLGEWEGLTRYPVFSSANRPPEDISGDFSFCYSADSLYMAGRVTDDDFVRDGAVPWEPFASLISDAVEVFVDLDLGDSEVGVFDEDDVQLFLMPLNRGRRWEPFQWLGQRGPRHQSLTGLDLATREHEDGRAYDFEVRMPLAPFGLYPRKTRVIGFNIAINDQDSEDVRTPRPAQEYYLTLNGEQNLYRDVRRLCRLRFVGNVGAGRSRVLASEGLSVVMVAGLLVLLAAVAVWTLRRKQDALPHWGRWKIWAAAASAVIGVLWLLPETVIFFRDRGLARDLEADTQQVRDVLGQLVQDHQLRERLRGANLEDLGNWLQGGLYRSPGTYSYRMIDVLGEGRGPGEYVSSVPIPNVPFLEYGIVLGEGEDQEDGRLRLKLPKSEPASRVHFAVAAFLDDAPQIQDLLEVRLLFDNGAAAAHAFTLDDAADIPLGHHGDQWGIADERGGLDRSQTFLATEVNGRKLRHIDHRVFEVPAHFHEGSQEAALNEIVLQRASGAEDVPVWLSGITVERGLSRRQFEPLRLGSVDPGGFPFAIRRGRPALRELAIRPGQQRAIDLRPGGGSRRVDRLRIYFRAEGQTQGNETGALSEGASRARILVTVQGRPEPLVFPLRMGIEVAPEFHSFEDLPASMTSFLASTTEGGSGPWRYVGYELPFDEHEVSLPLSIDRFEVEVPEASAGKFFLGALTTATAVEPPPLEEGSFLSLDTRGRLRLDSEVTQRIRSPLDRRSFALIEGGVAQFVGSGLGRDTADRIRGSRVSFESSSDELPVLQEAWAGKKFLSATFELPLGDRSLGLTLLQELPSSQPIIAIRRGLFLLLGILGLPLGILALVRRLTDVTRIKSRLSFLFLLTSVVPLTLVFLLLVNLVLSQRGRDDVRRAEERLEATRRCLTDLARESSVLARRLVAELADQPELLGVEAMEGFLADEARSAPPGMKIRVTLPPSEDGEEPSIHYSDSLGSRDRRWEAPNTGLSLCWGAVVFSAVEERQGIQVQVAGQVVPETLRQSPAGDDQFVALLAPFLEYGDSQIEGGAVMVGDEDPRLASREEREEVARSLADGDTAVTLNPKGRGARAYDLIRGSEGNPVAIAAVTIPDRPLTIDLGFIHLDLLGFVLLIGAVAMVCAVVLGALVTEGITSPLGRLQRGARALAAGNEASVEIRGDDEVSDLARSFNAMSEELQRRIRDQEFLSSSSSSLTQSLELEERVRVALQTCRETFGSGVMACYLYDLSRDQLVLQGQDTGSQPDVPAFPEVVPAPTGRLREVLRESGVHWASPAELEPFGARSPASGLLLSLGRAGRPTGLLVFLPSSGEDPMQGLDATFVRNLLTQVAVALDNARLFRAAVEDPVTGLPVASHFMTRWREEIDRVSVDGGQVAVAAFGLRVPKDRNPSRFHELASEVAALIRRHCHPREVVGHVDASTFAALVPSGGGDRAREIAEDVLRLSRETASVSARLQQLSAQITHAAVLFPEEGKSQEFLWRLLQQRLSGSKPMSGGDERVVLRSLSQQFPQWSFDSPRMAPVVRQIAKVAESEATVLILGETGTGKEIAAQLIHQRSSRSAGPFVPVHCAALPEKLLESELFGHEKGAFTGADQRRLGRFEQADRGTLFLDEIAEIPLEVQVKLLRVLQEHRLQRLGGSEEIAVNVRIVAATHRNLQEMVEQGAFREDLFYRLKVVEVVVPPLRERLEEIPGLVDRFLAEIAADLPDDEVGPRMVEPAVLDLLACHDWPGNIRELRNVIQRAVVLGRGERVSREDIDLGSIAASGAAGVVAPPTVVAMDGLNPRQRDLVTLLVRQGRVTARELVEALGVSRRTVLRDLTELIERGVIVRDGTRKAAIYRIPEGDTLSEIG